MNCTRSLTEKQKTVFNFIQNKIHEDGRPPTIREIGKQFAFKSTGTTRGYLKSLKDKGYLAAVPKQSRSLKIIRKDTQKIPILGEITAGVPNLTLEEISDYLNPSGFLPESKKDIFALKIKGDSMIEKGIHDGDLAIIRKQEAANESEIIAALIDQEATIKILKKKKGKFILAPANQNYCEIEKPFSIIGKVVAVIKRF